MQKGKGYMPKMTMTEWMAQWQSITFHLRSLKNEKLNNMPIVPDKSSIEYDYYKRDQRRKAGLL